MQGEIADIFRLHGEHYKSHYPVNRQQNKAMRDIVLCRTAGLGGHVEVCDHGCGYARIWYHSCRNRHCPKCQNLQQARWLRERMQRLLPTHYFHMVVTLPHELNPLALKNKERFYNLLFRAASHALLELAKGYKRLGAQVGFTAVLHTWDQDLQFHPHLHIVVTGGGLDPCTNQWIPSKNTFLVPVRALSQIVRGKFIDSLEEAFHEGKLLFPGVPEHLKDPPAFRRFMRNLRRKKWVLYCKEPFDGPQQAYAYLSRYTHRVAISNHRLVSLLNGKVTFRARNNHTAGHHRLVTLAAEEFIRRFLLHILPTGFVRIRHYGLLAPRNATTKLQEARRLILQMQPLNHPPSPHHNAPPDTTSQNWQELMYTLTRIDLTICPRCGGKFLRMRISCLSTVNLLREQPIAFMDSS